MLLETLNRVGYQFLVNLPTDFCPSIFLFLNDNSPAHFHRKSSVSFCFRKHGRTKKIMAIPNESDELIMTVVSLTWVWPHNKHFFCQDFGIEIATVKMLGYIFWIIKAFPSPFFILCFQYQALSKYNRPGMQKLIKIVAIPSVSIKHFDILKKLRARSGEKGR